MAPVASMSTPYRVQFGAFRRAASANELAAMLSGAGVASEVFASPGTGVNPVVTQGGFASSDAAQRWIDFEGARRGRRERPAAIR
jgi:cell division septation protein DedD